MSSAVVWRLWRLTTRGGGLARMTGKHAVCSNALQPHLERTRLWSDTASPANEGERMDTNNGGTATDQTDPSPSSPSEDSRLAILQAALHFVPEYGWTPVALREGAKSLDLPPSSSSLAIFPRGGGELVDHFEQESNNKLVEFMEKLSKEEKLKGSKLLRSGLEHRLSMLIPYMDKWPQAMALKAFPSNSASALENLALMVDDMWYCAGDRSTDFNWYTKRATLAAVYCSTEVYMIQDGSVDCQDTWDFLDRRLEDTANFSKVRRQLEDSLNSTVELLSAGVTTARNMMGLNPRHRP